MAKTKAERMKEYRARKKALLGDEWLKRENRRVKSYFVPISELSEEKQLQKRERNRRDCAKYRLKRKRDDTENQQVENPDLDEMPSSSIDDNQVSSTTNDDNHGTLTIKMKFNRGPSCSEDKQSSRQSRGRKRVSRALAKQYRRNETLEDENESLRRKLNTVRRQLNRIQNRSAEKCRGSPLTPRSKTDSILSKSGINPKAASEVRQKILFAECIGEEIKDAVKSNKQGFQAVVRRVVSGKIIKKYRLRKTLANIANLDRTKLNSLTKSVDNIIHKSRNTVANAKVTNDIRTFLERDDNSRMLPGKGDAVKVGKVKRQKRVLNDYMYNLHSKFCAESTYKISLASFCRKKPKEIDHVNFSSRSVCLCSKHQNFAMKLRCLKNNKITSITSPDKFMDTYGSEEELCHLLNGMVATTIRYQEWRRKKMSDGRERMRIIDIELPKGEFIEVMKETYGQFEQHIKRVVEQYKAIKAMKESLPKGHVLIQMDFSENYICQSMEEIQSAYWNATAVTLHPSVMYFNQEDGDGGLNHTSIVFVSEVLHHNASMVVTIIDKMVTKARERVQGLQAVHFWTDSPTSQYRNKTIFDYISRFYSMYGLESSWHYFECGHGKGPCDGVGGATKRSADNAIKQGKVVIQDADDFYKWASNTDSQIQFSRITTDEYESSKEKVEMRNAEIIPVKGTMKVHSVIAVSAEHIKTRETTCVCKDCYQENGFNENTRCSWTKHCLTKVQRRVRNTESDNSNVHADQSDKVQEINNNVPEAKIPSNTDAIHLFMNENDYVVILYEKKNYIGRIIDCDDEDNEVEVTCMETCGKVEGRFKWPRTEDKIWISKRNVLKVIDEPKATGRTRRTFCVDDETAMEYEL